MCLLKKHLNDLVHCLPFGFGFVEDAVDEEDSDHSVNLGLGEFSEKAAFAEKLDNIPLHQLPLRRSVAGGHVIRELGHPVPQKFFLP